MSDLIDREALLDECLNHYEVGNIEQNCTMDWICKTVRNFPTFSPWHRVEDGLPKEEKRYFVWEADGYAFCDTWKEGKWKIGSGVPGTHITHWMPLPEPPKEVKNE